MPGSPLTQTIAVRFNKHVARAGSWKTRSQVCSRSSLSASQRLGPGASLTAQHGSP